MKDEKLSANKIAAILERSPEGVIRAIERLDIKPTGKVGTRNLYDRSVVGRLRDSMRSKNGTRKETA